MFIKPECLRSVFRKGCEFVNMEVVVWITVLQLCGYVAGEIRDSVILNKLKDVKPVGGLVAHKFAPLTELPPPLEPHQHADGRRHLDPDCTQKPGPNIVYEGGKVDIFGEYYDDKVAKTVATVIIPDHIDHKHFEVTTPEPWFTLGPIDAIGYHPSTIKGEHPSECEKIYQDHVDNEYTEEDTDVSEESLEMVRMPLMPDDQLPDPMEEMLEKMYSDMDK